MGGLFHSLWGVCRKIGLGPCVKAKWVTASKSGVTRLVDTLPEDVVQVQLRKLQDLDAAAVNELKKRKLVAVATLKSVRVLKGLHFSVDGPRDLAKDLTAEMLADGSWATQPFKVIASACFRRGFFGRLTLLDQGNEPGC